MEEFPKVLVGKEELGTWNFNNQVPNGLRTLSRVGRYKAPVDYEATKPRR